MARPIPAFTLPALAVCAVLSGCAGTPGPDATPVRTASARINATTVAQPDPSAPVAGWTRFAEMKDGSVRVTAEIRHLKPGGAVGFHIHDKGDCSGDGNAAGGHFHWRDPMNRFSWTALGMALMLAACNASTPNEASEGGAAAEGEEHGEHEEAPLETKIAAKAAQAAGIQVAPAGPGEIADEHEVQGLLTPIDGRIAQVTARFPGPVRSVRAGVGDQVRAGQALATVESNLSLTTYTVTAPISGVVMARTAAVGMAAAEGAPLFEVADLSTLWVDLHIFGADVQHIGAGVPVTVTRLSDGVTAQTTLERVLPGTATASQSTIARATVANSDGLWRPGSAVKARVTVDRQSAALVVPITALQTAEDQDVIYVQQGETYHTRPVKLGRRDAERAEVLEGLKAGEQVVVAQSFLIKADIEKSTVEEE